MVGAEQPVGTERIGVGRAEAIGCVAAHAGAIGFAVLAETGSVQLGDHVALAVLAVVIVDTVNDWGFVGLSGNAHPAGRAENR